MRGERRLQTVSGSDEYARIRAVVSAIPPGSVATYGQVAALAGLGGHARQVGYAMRTLPDDSTVPWQRVINARGEVSRRAGEDGLGPSQGFQRHLLEEEGVLFDATGQVDLERYGWTPEVSSGSPANSGQRNRRDANATPAVRQVIADFDRELSAAGSPQRAAGEQRYLRSKLTFRGVSVPVMRRLARVWLRAHPDIPRRRLVAIARGAWRGEVHEVRSIAVEILVARADQLEDADLALLEWMLRRAGTWAHVDVIAPVLVGSILDRHRAATVRVLDRWSRDGDFWLRRASLLALMPSLRRDDRDWRRFASYADRMLEEREFFIRKAIGWVLRELAKRDPRRVAEFVARRLPRISGVSFREAVRRLPSTSRSRLEKAFRAGRKSPAAR